MLILKKNRYTTNDEQELLYFITAWQVLGQPPDMEIN